MSNNIKRATVSDMKLISQLGAKTFDQAFRGTCTDQDLEGVLQEFYCEEQVAKELSNPKDYFFVLYQNEVATGYARINLSEEPKEYFLGKKAVELKRIYFLNEFHGKGLAQQLLAYCLDFLRKQDYKMVYLSVWEHNDRAQAFYKKHGFVDSKIQNPFPLGDTPQMDYWFTKEL